MSSKNRSGGLRTGSGQAGYVDESLFASTTKLPTIKRLESSEKTSPKMMKRSLIMTCPDMVTVSQDQLHRMLKPSPILSAEEVVHAKNVAADRLTQKQEVSKLRKEKMMRMEEEARKHVPLTESDKIRQVSDAACRTRAEELLEEELDDVKHMNQMMLYSKCVTIRDAQIEEKRLIMQENVDDSRRQDMAMECDRIRALEQYEAREAARNEERRHGARVLEEQISERERERIRLEELREKERIAMMKELERLKEEELQQQLERKIRGKQLMEEVAAANSEQIRRKEVMKVREKEEDQKIQDYVKTKMSREQEVQAEKERIAHEKEIEMARMRTLQEKEADKQAELDELRARRYQEAKEREWRAKERAAVERAAAIQLELCDAREAQKNAAITQRADMARMEQNEFVRVLTVNRAKEHAELVATVTKQEVNTKYMQDLVSQVAVNEEKRKKGRQEYLEDGVKMRASADKEKAKLLEIKSKKLGELTECGVPDKYRTELQKMKIME